MNTILNKLERKLGKYAIPNLIVWLLAGYAIGFVLLRVAPDVFYMMTLEPYYILRGEVWRLITWVLVPPSTNVLFALIMILFYYQLGQALERTWGTFRFNVYIFGGIIFTILGAFLLYAISFAVNLPVRGMGFFFSTNYINMTIFLAFAVCYPQMQVYLYFLIPIKMKWLAIVYCVMIALEMFETDWAGRVAILMSVLNFLIFYFSTRNYKQISPKEVRRKQKFRAEMRSSVPRAGVTKHKCAICGRTELDDPNLEFRFCSKCEGNYEYCQDHLFTHQHVHRS